MIKKFIALAFTLITSFQVRAEFPLTDIMYSLGPNTFKTVGVSGDGSYAVGWQYGIDPSFSPNTGYIIDLKNRNVTSLEGIMSRPYAVSLDGNFIVGSYNTTNGDPSYGRHMINAALWDRSGKLTTLGSLDESTSLFKPRTTAMAVSFDGSIVVGHGLVWVSDTVGGREHAFMWTKQSNKMIDLNPSDNFETKAYGISANGSTIVGSLRNHADIDPLEKAVKFTINNDSTVAIKELGSLGNGRSYAYGVSADGSIIVGTSDIDIQKGSSQAFRYTDATGMLGIGYLPGHNQSAATAISADGKVIIGWSGANSNRSAFKYVDNKMIDLGSLGGSWTEARALSSDGAVIVGFSKNAAGEEEGFIYRNKMVSIPNTYKAILQEDKQLNSIINLQSSILKDRLNYDCDSVGKSGVCIAAGSSYNFSSSSAALSTANFRIGFQATPNFRIGGFVDQSINNRMPSNYEINNHIPMVGLFGVWSEPNGLGTKIKASIAFSKNDLDITRSVLLNTEAGKGSTSLLNKGAQFEAAYGIKINNKWIAQPFSGMRYTYIRRDSYTEDKNADFFVTYNPVEQSTTSLYAGINMFGKINTKLSTSLSVGIENDSRYAMSNNSGQINYLDSFSINSPKQLNTRGFIGGIINYELYKKTTLQLGLRASQNPLNNDVFYSASANIYFGF